MKRNNRRLTLSLLSGAAALALAAVTAAPANADDAPGTDDIVVLPADTVIEEAVPLPAGATPPTIGALSKAANQTDSCLGYTVGYGATGCFVPYGDVIWVEDTLADGYSAAVIVTTDYGRAPYACVNKGGKGSLGSCNKDYREDGHVKLQVMRYDSDTGIFHGPSAYSGSIAVG